MNTRKFSRKLAAAKKAAARGKVVEVKDDDTGETFVFSANPKAKWQFTPDAIGMASGPKNLSQRKGLSA